MLVENKLRKNKVRVFFNLFDIYHDNTISLYLFYNFIYVGLFKDEYLIYIVDFMIFKI